MHNSASPLLKASALAEPKRWEVSVSPWVRHTLRWVLFYTGWLSVIHLSMQHTWSSAGGLGVAAAWWVLLHWHPLRTFQKHSWLLLLMVAVAALGLAMTQFSGQQALALTGLMVYVLGLSFLVHAVDNPKRYALMHSTGWSLASCHGVAIALALLFAANHLMWAWTWPLFLMLMAAALIVSLHSREPTHHSQQTLHICQPDPTMALMMAFLPLFSLWCATPWLNSTQHLGLHLMSMAAGPVIMLMVLKRFPPAAQHPMWGHVLCISATGLIWATTETTLMLAAMVLLSAGSMWTQLQRPLDQLGKSIALLLGVLSISFTAHWAHTLGPDALSQGLLVTSMLWTLTHLGLHLRSSHE